MLAIIPSLFAGICLLVLAVIMREGYPILLLAASAFLSFVSMQEGLGYRLQLTAYFSGIALGILAFLYLLFKLHH